MAEESDQNLICAYTRNRSNDAFGEIVHRHVDLVYSTAYRIVRDAHLAEDVTQRVFIALDRHAARLRNRAALSSWLHETARNFAVSAVRSEQRRRLREREAVSVNMNDSTATDDLWNQVAPHLDDALANLREADRDLILWRYFERETSGQIGERLGLSAEAAQKRIARALDRLRTAFAERGLTTPTAGFAAVLSTQAIQSAPAGLASTAIASVAAAGSVLSAPSILGIVMESTKVKIGIAAALAVGVTVPLVQQYKNSQLQREIRELRARTVQPQPQNIVADMGELERLRSEQAELLRLRARVTELDQQLAQSAKVRTQPTLKEQRQIDRSEETKALLAKSPEIPMIASNTWANAGLTSPASTLQTLQWAIANRDTNTILASFCIDPKTRQSADAAFALLPESLREKYGSLDNLFLRYSLNWAPSPSGYRILSQADNSPEHVTLVVQLQYPDGNVGEGWTDFYRDEHGDWRLGIPSVGILPIISLAATGNRTASSHWPIR